MHKVQCFTVNAMCFTRQTLYNPTNFLQNYNIMKIAYELWVIISDILICTYKP